MESSRDRGFEYFVRITLTTVVLIQYLAMPYSVQAAQSAHADPTLTARDQIQALRQRTNETNEAYLERMSVEQPELVQNAALVTVQGALNGTGDAKGDLESSVIQQIDGAIDDALADPDLGAAPNTDGNFDTHGTYNWETFAFDGEGQVNGAWAMQADPGPDVDQAAFEEAFESRMEGRVPDEVDAPTIEAQTESPQPFDPFTQPVLPDNATNREEAADSSVVTDASASVESDGLVVSTDTSDTSANVEAPQARPIDAAPRVVSTVTCTIYVNGDATGANDGSDWANAYTSLDTALLDANNCKGSGIGVVNVAAGIYVPSDPSIGFVVNANVMVYGGFNAADGTRDATANPAESANPTILSGDVDGNDTTDVYGVTVHPNDINGTNSEHVVWTQGFNGGLDGFTITGGDTKTDFGGGGIHCDTQRGEYIERYCRVTLHNLYIVGNRSYAAGGGFFAMFEQGYWAEPEISGVTFINNHAQNGGGFYVGETNIDFAFDNGRLGFSMTDTTFKNNVATQNGGGIQVDSTGAGGRHQGHITLNDVTFENNIAGANGGGLSFYGSMAYRIDTVIGSTLTNVHFISNTASSGGGLSVALVPQYYNYQYPDDISVTLKQAVFNGNSADRGGAIFQDTNVRNIGYASDSEMRVVNTTLVNNRANQGGAIYNTGERWENYANIHVHNSIFANNVAQEAGHQIYNTFFGKMMVTYSYLPTRTSADVVEDYIPITYGQGILEGNPYLFDIDGLDNVAGNADDDLRLSPASLAIDSGDNERVSEYEITTDLSGATRIVDDLDMVGTGNGNDDALVDMGAYEQTVRTCAGFDGILYVNPAATGDRSGVNWANARHNLLHAMEQAGVCNLTMHVAGGVYTPNKHNAAESFLLRSNVKLYGGYAGSGDTPDQRDHTAHPTILSGDIGGDDSNKDAHGVTTHPDDIVGTNSDRVLSIGDAETGSYIDSETILDGMTVTAGDASGSGAGIYCDGTNTNTCSPKLNNVTVIGNRAATMGGGLLIDGQGGTASPELHQMTLRANVASSGAGIGLQVTSGTSEPTLANSIVANNRASSAGGGLWIEAGSGGQANPIIRDVTFEANSADSGGGLFSLATNGGQTAATVHSTRFIDNSATTHGGGFASDAQVSSSSTPAVNAPTLRQVVFNDNTALSGGAVWHRTTGSAAASSASVLTLVNGTLVNNEATDGGAVYASASGNGGVNLYNSIFATNTAQAGNQLYTTGGNMTVAYALLPSQDSADVNGSVTYGDGVLTGNPLFEDADGADDVAGNTDDNLRLLQASAAVDSGSGVYLEDSGVERDFDGNPRTMGAQIDLGGYEFTPWVTIAGLDNTVYDLTAKDDGTIYAAGAFGDYVAAFDGTTWTMLPGLDAEAHALWLTADETLYAAGLFTAGVAQWTGSAWQPVGSGLPSGTVVALTQAADGTFYAAGAFGVYAFNGSGAWQQLGNIDNVRALTHYNGDLYAGGNFTSPGTGYIARWDGTTWQALEDANLPNGLGGAVNALAVYAGQLAIGGEFALAGNGFFFWDGQQYSQPGIVKTNDTVSTKVIDLWANGSQLALVGDFDTADDAPAFDLAIWTGTRFMTTLGGLYEVGNHIKSVVLAGDELFAGGSFAQIGGRDTPNVGLLKPEVADLRLELNAASDLIWPVTTQMTLTVHNDGSAALADATVGAALPNGFTFVNSDGDCTASGQIVQCTVGNLQPAVSMQRVFSVAVATGEASSTATVHAFTGSAGSFDQTADNNTNQQTINLAVDPSVLTDLGIAIAPNITFVTYEGVVTYTVTVSNTGTGAGRDVLATITLPSGGVHQGSSLVGCTPSGNTVLCDLDQLDPNANLTFDLYVQMTGNGAVQAQASLADQSTTPQTYDSNPADNSATSESVIVFSENRTTRRLGNVVIGANSFTTSDGVVTALGGVELGVVDEHGAETFTIRLAEAADTLSWAVSAETSRSSTPVITGSGTVQVMATNRSLFRGPLKIQDPTVATLAPNGTVTAYTDKIAGFMPASEPTFTGVSLVDGVASLQSDILITPPGVETTALFNGQLAPDGSFSGGIQTFTLAIASLELLANNLTVTDGEISADTVTIKMPDSLGGLSKTASGLRVRPQALLLGDIGKPIDLPDILIGDGSHLKLQDVTGTVGYFGGAYTILADAMLNLNLPGNGEHPLYPASFVMQGNGKFTGSLKYDLTVDVGGSKLAMHKVKLTEQGLSTNIASLSLPTSLSRLKTKVKDVQITADGLSVNANSNGVFPLPNIRFGTTLVLKKMKATLKIETVDSTTTYSLVINGIAAILVPKNNQKVKFSAGMVNGSLTGSINKLVIKMAGTTLTMEQLKLADGSLSVKTAKLKMPELLNGVTVDVQDVVINDRGIHIGEAGVEFPMPSFTIGDEDGPVVLTVSDAWLRVGVSKKALSYRLRGTVRIDIGPDHAEVTGSMRIDTQGKFKGTVKAFSLNVVGISLTVKNATFKEGVLRAKQIGLGIPEQWGGLKTTVYDLRVGEGRISIGGGYFQLPPIQMGNIVMRIGGGFHNSGDQVIIRADGLFEMANFDAQATGCSGIEVGLEIYVDINRGLVMDVQPLAETINSPERDLALAEGRAISGMGLRNITVAAKCRIPIDSTGFSLTEVRGSLTLNGGTVRVELSVTIQSDFKFAGVPAIQSKPTLGIESGPGYMQIDFKAAVEVFAIFKAAQIDAKMRFGQKSPGDPDAILSAKLNINMTLFKGSVHLTTWTQDGSFHLVGGGTIKIGVDKGDIGRFCIPIIGCASLPPFDMSFSVGTAFGEFHYGSGTTWGLKAYIDFRVLGKSFDIGIYVSTAGQFAFGSVSRYQTITPPSIRRAAMLQDAVRYGRLSRAVLSAEEQKLLDAYHMADDDTVLVDFTVIDGDVMVNFAHAADEPNLELRLIRPDGLEIALNNLPDNIAMEEYSLDPNEGEEVTVAGVQQLVVLSDVQPGVWQVKLLGATTANHEYILEVLGSVGGPTVTDLDLAQVDDTHADVTWAVSSNVPTTTVNIYASAGPITTTEVITTDGVAETVVIDQFGGGIILPDVDTTLDGISQTVSIDFSSWESGEYWVWVDANDSFNPPTRKYTPGKIIVDHPWDDSWAASTVITPSYRTLDIQWDRHTNRDVDAYHVYLTPDGENFHSTDTQVWEVGDVLFTSVGNLLPNTEYAVKIVGIDYDTDRESHSELNLATAGGAPFTVALDPAALTLVSGASETVQLTLTADEEPFPTRVVLEIDNDDDFESEDDFIAADITTDVLTPTIAGVTTQVPMTVSDVAVGGLYTVTVRASAGGDERLVEIPVTVLEPSFELRASAETVTLTEGISATIDIDAVYLNGESDDIIVWVDIAPDGFEGTFDAGDGFGVGEKATLTITDTNLLANGAYTVTVQGSDGDNLRSLDLTLVIDKPTFALRGDSGTEAQTSHNNEVRYTVALDGDGWDEPVNVVVDTNTLSGFVTPTIQLNTRALIHPPATFDVIVEVGDDTTTPAGVYEMVLVANSAGVSETLPLQLAIGADNPQPDMQVSYELSANEVNAGDLVTLTTRYENRGAVALNSDIDSGYSHTRTITGTEPLLIPITIVGCNDLIAGTDVNGFDGDYRCDAFGTLESGDSFELTTIYRVHEGADDGAIAALSEMLNTPNDFDVEDNTWRAEITVRNTSDVNVELSASDASQNAGESVTYTAVVKTNGNADVSGAEVIFTPDAMMGVESMSPSCALTVDGTVMCSVGAIHAGCARPTPNDPFACVMANATSQSVTLTVGIDPAATAVAKMGASVSSMLADPDSTNNDDSESVTVTTSSALSPSLLVGVDTSDEGGTHNHTLVVTNNGPSVARNVTVSYTLPAAASYATLEVNGIDADKTNPEIISGFELQPSEAVTITMAIVHMQDTSGTLVNSVITIGADGETTQTVDLGRTVNNVAPDIELVNPPIVVNEGETLRLTAVASDTTPLDEAGSNWSVDWDLDNDGSYDDRTGNVAVIDATELDGVSNLARSATTTTIGVQATDGVASGQTSHTFTVRNVAPTVDAGADQVQPVIQPFTVNADFTDPAAADTHTAVMKWGDGIEEAVTVDGKSVTASHTYTAIGEYDAELCVTDDDGGEGCDKIELQASCLDHGLVASDLSYRFDNRKLIATTQLSYLGTLLPNPLPSEVALTMYNGDTAIDTVTVENVFALNHSSSIEFEWDMVSHDTYTLTVALDDDGAGNHPLSLCVSGKPDVEADTGIVTQAAPAAGESKVYGPTQVTIKQGLTGTNPGTITVTKVLEDVPDDGLLDARWVVEADEEENLDIELTICWAESDLTPEQTANEPSFTIYHRHEPTDNWSSLFTTVDEEANCAMASVTQFSEFTVGKAAPTAVRLESFTTTVDDSNSVTIDWETSQEVDHAGFNLYRRDAGTRSAWQPVNDQLIASYGTQAQGAVYQFVDTHVPVGNWDYLLEDVESDGDTYQHLTHIAAVQVGTPSSVQLSNAEIVVTSPAVLWLMSALLLATTVQFVHARRKRHRLSRQKG